MPAIWITINPNDINNPVKMRLSIHRLHEHGTAKELLADLQGTYDRIALSILDPVSAAIFFHREISIFFEKYVRTGQESVFGKISHYYATVETNDRGSLHLHGLLWLEGNMQLPSLIDDMAKPEEDEYRAQVVRYPVLEDVCLYDYMSMITLERRRDRGEDETHIALEGPPECGGWIQKLRQPAEYAVPIFQGFISDEHMDEHPVYFKRYAPLAA
jgi:hypothetical protein